MSRKNKIWLSENEFTKSKVKLLRTNIQKNKNNNIKLLHTNISKKIS